VVLLAVWPARAPTSPVRRPCAPAIPSANPSSYIGSSTSIGTPVAIALGIPLFIALKQVVFGP
jgi:hypothetical protein